jgi:hypothetical protein
VADKWAPASFHIFKDFPSPKFEIQIGDLIYVQYSPTFVGRQFVTKGTTLLVGPTSKSLRISSYKFGNKFKFEYFLNFKGVQIFLEKSDKFSKIPYSHAILEYQFILTYLYSNIGSSFTSG